ncbi:phage tail baseplate protein, partial [Propylenella binzhouense]|uniref:GTA baseplate fiber-binding domain-containing protein n=1 Tax=Propylenella binzhouense TaxID=2555902 RepID=UPI003CCDC866
ILELAPPPDGADAHAPRLAVFADPWPGTIAVHAAAEGGGFRLVKALSRRAVLGRLETALLPGPVGRYDRANAPEVTLFGGALASLPEIDLLGGGNLAAVRAATGDWEVLQFARADLVGERRYRLGRLLRAQGDSGPAMAAGAPAGADFVLLDEAVTALPVAADQIGRPLRLRIGPAQDSHFSASYTALTVTPAGRGLRPFSPVHLKAARAAESGDVRIAWTRRTRFGGDAWEPPDVPLNEASEAYRLEILDAGAPIRTVGTGAPEWLYSAADQTADWGMLPAVLTVRVAQRSATMGPGLASEGTFHV